MLEAVRSFSEMVLESLPSRSRIAAAVALHRGRRAAHGVVDPVPGQDVAGGLPEADAPARIAGQVVVGEVALPRVDAARCRSGPTGPSRRLRWRPLFAPARARTPPAVNAASRSGSSRSAVSGWAAVECSASLRLPETSVPEIRWFAPSLDAKPDPIAPDRASQHRDAVHVLAGDAHAHEAGGHRVSALQHHAGEIDPGTRRGGDDHPPLGGIGDAIAAGADPHLALHLGAGARGPDARRGARRRSGAASASRVTNDSDVMGEPDIPAHGGMPAPREVTSRGNERS